MAMQTIYSCNICGEVKSHMDLLGVCFKDNVHFSLGGYGCTDGVHICVSCAEQLRDHLNKIDLDSV